MIMKYNVPESQSPFDIQLASFVCYVFSTVLLVTGFWRLFSVEMSDVQFLLGSLLVLNLTVMGVIVGLILPVSLRYQQLAHAEEHARK